MKVNLKQYADKRICVAVSGGKDSMALLHYMKSRAHEYGISVSALNCDHAMRGASSARDSAFVAAYCEGNDIVLYSFTAEKGAFKDENGARKWRLECYKKVLEEGKADCIATAHHMNDNAETVLFNLARGASLSGVCGIADEPSLKIIRPLIACTRGQIDEYVAANKIPFVTDESNLTDDYTRNKIRHNVLPELESAVQGAVGAIYRFSRLAREDEEYFSRKVKGITVERGNGNFLIKPCRERVIFKRAAASIISDGFMKCDYTHGHLQTLFDLQKSENGKKFEFIGLVAVKENGGVAIAQNTAKPSGGGIAFYSLLSGEGAEEFANSAVRVVRGECAEKQDGDVKILYFDLGKIPQNAVVRTRRTGDKFTKFGGGTVSLSDYFTDKKVPQSMRDCIPLVCVDGEVLIVGGVEISDKVKVTHLTYDKGFFICKNPLGLL